MQNNRARRLPPFEELNPKIGCTYFKIKCKRVNKQIKHNPYEQPKVPTANIIDKCERDGKLGRGEVVRESLETDGCEVEDEVHAKRYFVRSVGNMAT